MTFLVDAQLPPALAQFLRTKGHAAEHVSDCGILHAADSRIWQHARASGAAIISKDEDFAARTSLDPTGPCVVWLRVGNCSNRALIQWFEPLLPTVIDRLQRGDKLVEVI